MCEGTVEGLWQAKLGGMGSQGITMVRQVMLARLMGITDVAPTCTGLARYKESSAKEQ